MKRLNKRGVVEVVFIGWAVIALLCALAVAKGEVPPNERNNADRWYDAELYRP